MARYYCSVIQIISSSVGERFSRFYNLRFLDELECASVQEADLGSLGDVLMTDGFST